MSEYRPGIGETVQIVNTGHEATDAAGHLGRVKMIAEWGVYLETAFGSKEYRALWREVAPILKPASAGLSRNAAPQVKNGAAVKVRANGYSGPACDTCGGYNLSQSGACFKCEDCGSASGCS